MLSLLVVDVFNQKEMQLKKYRFNRKDGTIYLESQLNHLIKVGSELKVIILWASAPTFGKPFAHLSAQHWIQLTFLNDQGDWCYAVLNNGTTNALYPWTQYQKSIESSHKLFEVITTISFERSDESESDYQWFDYKFSGVLGKPGISDRISQLINTSPYGLVDKELSLMLSL